MKKIFMLLIAGFLVFYSNPAKALTSVYAGSHHKVWSPNEQSILGWLPSIPDITTKAEAYALEGKKVGGPTTFNKIKETGDFATFNFGSDWAIATGEDGSYGYANPFFTGKVIDKYGMSKDDLLLEDTFGFDTYVNVSAYAEAGSIAKGIAIASAEDPFHFQGLPADYEPFKISSSLSAGTTFSINDPLSISSLLSSAWTNVTDYESLYTLEIISDTDGLLKVDFQSNSLFGLDDDSIEALILSSFAYDEFGQKWKLYSDLEYFSVDFKPVGYDSFDLGFDDYSMAAAAPTPEPSTVIIGFMGLAGVLRSRKQRKIVA